MSIILFGLELYLAAMLSISGLAKLVHPNQFKATLNQHRILPQRSVWLVGMFFPVFEILVAGFLLSGMARIFTAVVVLILFVSFLIIKLILTITSSTTDCGCYGTAHIQQIDNASIGVSVVLVLIATFHLWASSWALPVFWSWRLFAIILYAAIGCWLLWRVIGRHRMAFSSWRGRPAHE